MLLTIAGLSRSASTLCNARLAIIEVWLRMVAHASFRLAYSYGWLQIGERIRFSDDGEPGGTAGRPILSAIVASGLDRTVVVVIR